MHHWQPTTGDKNDPRNGSFAACALIRAHIEPCRSSYVEKDDTRLPNVRRVPTIIQRIAPRPVWPLLSMEATRPSGPQVSMDRRQGHLLALALRFACPTSHA